MSCNDDNFIEYYPGDNQPITVSITDQDGKRIDNIIEDANAGGGADIKFHIKNSDGTLARELSLTGGKITFAKVKNEDVATITPAIEDTQLTPGDYPVFMRFELKTPDRNYHVDMTVDGLPFTKIVILSGGIS